MKYGPARGYGFLSAGGNLKAPSVVKVDSYVPMFTIPSVASDWIAAVNGDAEIAACRTNDELTSLLADLRSIGVKHVAFDPRPDDANPDVVSIESAILGFQLSGL